VALIKHPQPGNIYKVICIDGRQPRKEVVFTFVNVTGSGQFEIDVEGKKMVVGSFCDLCEPWACEVHSV